MASTTALTVETSTLVVRLSLNGFCGLCRGLRPFPYDTIFAKFQASANTTCGGKGFARPQEWCKTTSPMPCFCDCSQLQVRGSVISCRLSSGKRNSNQREWARVCKALYPTKQNTKNGSRRAVQPQGLSLWCLGVVRCCRQRRKSSFRAKWLTLLNLCP